jgi:hypothetical protein
MGHNDQEIDPGRVDILAPRLYLAESLADCQESHELVNLLKGHAHTIISSKRQSYHELYIFDQISRYIEVKCTPSISNSLLTAVLTVAL